MALYITILRIFLSIPTAYFIYTDGTFIAAVLVFVGILSDWLDGNIARKNREETHIGALLDPLADKIFVLSVLAVFLHKGMIDPIPYIFLLIRELSISFLRSLASERGISMKASYLGKAKTVFEFTAIIFLFFGFPYAQTVLWIAVVLAYASAYDYVIKYFFR